MSDPIYQGTDQGYFTCDRDPTISEPIIDIIPFPNPWLIYWWNKTSNNIFQCVDITSGDMIWQKISTDKDILSIINSAGWKLNISRAYSLRSSPSFNTSYQPSTTNDTNISVIISLTSTSVTPAQVDLQVDTGSGFNVVQTCSISGLAATTINTLNLIVPASAHYKLVNSSGSASITSINELSL